MGFPQKILRVHTEKRIVCPRCRSANREILLAVWPRAVLDGFCCPAIAAQYSEAARSLVVSPLSNSAGLSPAVPLHILLKAFGGKGRAGEATAEIFSVLFRAITPGGAVGQGTGCLSTCLPHEHWPPTVLWWVWVWFWVQVNVWVQPWLSSAQTHPGVLPGIWDPAHSVYVQGGP